VTIHPAPQLLPRPCGKPRRSRASALMLMIWAVLLMSLTVMGVVEYVGYSVSESTIANAEFRALYLAESGLAVGLHPSMRRGDTALKQKIGSDSGFDVVINYEGARIPINYLVDSRLGEAVTNLFLYWGLSAEQAGIAVDSLADWIDNDDSARPNGAESDYYKTLGIFDMPRQLGFISVDEMLLVRGMNVVDRLKPDWREYFSVYSDGVIDLRTAFKDTLMAVSGSSESDVDNYIARRDGPDGIPGTEDDQRISDSEAFRLLGIDGDRAAALRSTLTSEDAMRRITSTGYVGEKRVQIIVIARRGEDRTLAYRARIEE
jgi:general secretion pathway protein K